MALFIWSFVPLAAGAPLAAHIQTFSKVLLYFLFFVIALQLSSTDRASWVFALLGIAAIESLLLTIKAVFHLNNLPMLLGNPTYSALLLGSGIVYGFSWIRSGELSMKNRVLSTTVIIFMFVGLIITGSRSVILSVLLLAIFLLYKLGSRRLFVGFFLTSLLLAALFSTSFFDALKFDPTSAHSLNEYTWGRLSIWKTSLNALQSRWLTGYGLGNFEEAYWQNQQVNFGVLRYSKYTAFAHNDYLQLGVEMGVLGLGIFLGFLFMIFRSHAKQKSQDWISDGATLTVFMFLIGSFFNFNFYLPLNGLIFAVSLGLMGFKTESIRMPVPAKAAVMLVFVGFSLLALLNGFSEFYRKENKYEMALKLMPIRSDIWMDWARQPMAVEERLAKIDRALRHDGRNAFAWSYRARTLMHSSSSTLEDVLFALGKSITFAPHHAPFWVDLGFFYINENDGDQAKKAFLKAGELEPLASTPKLGLSLVHRLRGEKEKEIKMLQIAQELNKEYRSQVPASNYRDYLFIEIPETIRKKS